MLLACLSFIAAGVALLVHPASNALIIVAWYTLVHALARHWGDHGLASLARNGAMLVWGMVLSLPSYGIVVVTMACVSVFLLNINDLLHEARSAAYHNSLRG